MREWIGVDLDGTLAEYHEWKGVEIGKPIPAMVEKIKQLLAEGEDVRIFTARMCPTSLAFNEFTWWDQAIPIMEWCREQFGRILPIEYAKDFGMKLVYDDRAIQVEKNTGRLIG